MRADQYGMVGTRSTRSASLTHCDIRCTQTEAEYYTGLSTDATGSTKLKNLGVALVRYVWVVCKKS